MSELTDNDANRKAFAERLSLALGGQSARGIAKRAEISATAMSQYVSGKSEPTRPVLVALANTLGVRLEWLATGDGPMRPGESESVGPRDSAIGEGDARLFQVWKKLAGAAYEYLRQEKLLAGASAGDFVELVEALVEIETADGLPPDDYKPNIKKFRRLLR